MTSYHLLRETPWRRAYLIGSTHGRRKQYSVYELLQWFCRIRLMCKSVPVRVRLLILTSTDCIEAACWENDAWRHQ